MKRETQPASTRYINKGQYEPAGRPTRIPTMMLCDLYCTPGPWCAIALGVCPLTSCCPATCGKHPCPPQNPRLLMAGNLETAVRSNCGEQGSSCVAGEAVVYTPSKTQLTQLMASHQACRGAEDELCTDWFGRIVGACDEDLSGALKAKVLDVGVMPKLCCGGVLVGAGAASGRRRVA
jgi:hypothetical protein